MTENRQRPIYAPIPMFTMTPDLRVHDGWCVVWSIIHMYPVPSHLRQILHLQICGEKHIER